MDKNKETAPVVLFTYNRPEHTRNTIEALAKNQLADQTDLYVFSDAAKKAGDVGKVEQIRSYVENEVSGFKRKLWSCT